MPDFHHGVRVIEKTDGTRPIRTVETAVIGVVVTAPDAQPAIAASLVLGTAIANNAIAITGKAPGAAGNAISIAVVDPDEVSQALAVTVAGSAITVSLATDAEGAILSTAGEVIAALNVDAAALITAAADGTSNGSGIAAVSAAAKLAGGVDEPFPLDTPVLVAGSRTIAAKLDVVGDQRGTGPKIVDAIFDQIAPLMVVVRVAEGANEAETISNVIGSVDGATGKHTGLQALRTAKAKLGVTPRILGVPGLDAQAVTAELVSISDSLRGFVYASASGCETAEAAVLYRKNFGSKRLMLIWPDFTVWDTVKSGQISIRRLLPKFLR